MATRGRVRLLALATVVLLAAWLASALLGSGDHGRRPSPLVPAAGEHDPFAYDPGRRAEFERRGAAGLAHVLYAKSPGGALATAQRVARYRSLVDAVAGPAGVDPDVLEAIVFLESAGRPDARASDDPAGAVGLTQILAETGRGLLGMHIDTAASRRLTRRIARADRRHRPARARKLRAQRRRVDERYDPAKALRATARYLTFAKGKLGRDDLAVESYHMGVGNVQSVLAAFGAGSDTPYAELFYDSSPLRHPDAWAILGRLGDDSSTYLWRIHAAEDIMRRFRKDPAGLADTARRMTRKSSAEEVLQPAERTERFASPSDIEAALDAGRLTPLTAAAVRGAGLRIDRGMGALAPKLHAPRADYRALRPEALALLVYLGRGVQAIAGRAGSASLVLTSSVRDERYQRSLAASNPEATDGYSLHTTGWAFDIERRYGSRAQAVAFQFMLDRLQALNLIAWVREPAAIHVTAGPDAKRLLPLLERLPAGG